MTKNIVQRISNTATLLSACRDHGLSAAVQPAAVHGSLFTCFSQPHCVWLQGPPPPSSGAVSNYMKEGVNRLFRSSAISPPLSPRNGASVMSPSSIFQRTSAVFGRPPRKVT